MHFDNAEAERSNFSAGSLAQLQRYQNELKQLFLLLQIAKCQSFKIFCYYFSTQHIGL